MFSRSTLRVVLDTRWTPKPNHLAPTSRICVSPILSQRACLHGTSSKSNNAMGQLDSKQSSSSTNAPETPLTAIPRAQSSQPQQQQQQLTPTNEIPPNKRPIEPTFTTPLKLTKTLLSTLPNLATQKPHYVIAHLHAKPYLLTAGDHLRLPFLMPNVEPGDVLRFNRASAVGSRDFTLKGAPYVDERMFECRVRVLGVDAEPMRIKEKTKRRQRHVRQVRSKHKHTLLRVMEVRVKNVEELVGEGAVVDEVEVEEKA